MNKNPLKHRLERHPRLYLFLLRLKRRGHWSRDWVVTPETDITIEGFPRSGNSFAHSAFRAAQSRPRRIATHVHSAAQILRAAELRIPTLVLLRAPDHACLSLLALGSEIEKREPEDLDLGLAENHLIANLQIYRDFYARIQPVRDQFIVAEFSLLTENFAEIIRRLNQRFGTDFELYENSGEADQQLFQKAGFHLSPTPKRDAMKERMKRCFDAPAVQAAHRDARAVYENMLAIEQEQARRFADTPRAP